MRIILKIFAAPFALLFTVTAAFLAFVHAASAIFFSIASFLVFVGSIILFATGEPLGGAAYLIVAFLVSPFGLHALAGKLADWIGDAGGALRSFVRSRY